MNYAFCGPYKHYVALYLYVIIRVVKVDVSYKYLCIGPLVTTKGRQKLDSPNDAWKVVRCNVSLRPNESIKP